MFGGADDVALANDNARHRIPGRAIHDGAAPHDRLHGDAMTARICVAVLLVGCGTSSSTLALVGQIDDLGDRVDVIAYSDHGALEETDGVSASLHVRGQSFPLATHDNQLHAELSVSPPLAADEQVALELTRDGTTATVEVGAPPAIDLVVPFPIFVPRSQALTISWSTASDDPMVSEIDGAECLETTPINIDQGATMLVIPPLSPSPTSNRATCGATFRMQRQRFAEASNDGFASVNLVYLRHLDLPFASTP